MRPVPHTHAAPGLTYKADVRIEGGVIAEEWAAASVGLMRAVLEVVE